MDNERKARRPLPVVIGGKAKNYQLSILHYQFGK
jgi:hypothetical protein